MQYRLRLDGGDILVVTLEIEAAEEVEADPTSVGSALLAALGIGRPSVPAPKRAKMRVARQENEETPEEWMERTSREAMKGMQ